MGWTQADLDEVRALRKTSAGVVKIRHADGREVAYDQEQLAKLQREMEQDVVAAATSGGSMTTFAGFTRD